MKAAGRGADSPNYSADMPPAAAQSAPCTARRYCSAPAMGCRDAAEALCSQDHELMTEGTAAQAAFGRRLRGDA